MSTTVKTITLKEAKASVNKIMDLTLKELQALTNEELNTYNEMISTILDSKSVKKADKEDYSDFRETLANIVLERIVSAPEAPKAPEAEAEIALDSVANVKPPKKGKGKKTEAEAEKTITIVEQTPEEKKAEADKKKAEAEKKKKEAEAQKKAEADKKKKTLETQLKAFRAIKEGEKFNIDVKDSEEYETAKCTVKLVDEHSIILVDEDMAKYEITFERFSKGQWTKYIDNKKETLVLTKAV